MKILLDPYSGISGDMLIGALLHLGGDKEKLIKNIEKTGALKNVDVEIKRERSGPVESIDFVLKPRRKLKDLTPSEMRRIIISSKIESKVKENSLKMFDELLKVEALVHGTSEENVRFQELGGWDTIVDLTGISTLLEQMEIDEVFTYPVNMGRGRVKMEEGSIPSPAPATEILLKGFPVFREGQIESTTPTGAVFLKTFATPVSYDFTFTYTGVGYGLGKKKIKGAFNALRVYSLKEDVKMEEGIFEVETNIDDSTPEEMGDALERLFKLGALDAGIVPLIMKKGRPGFKLQVLVDRSHLSDVVNFLLEDTSTSGLRYWEVKRKILQRKMFKFKSSLGDVSFKVYRKPSGKKFLKIEMDNIQKIKDNTGKSLHEIKKIIQKECEDFLLKLKNPFLF